MALRREKAIASPSGYQKCRHVCLVTVATSTGDVSILQCLEQSKGNRSGDEAVTQSRASGALKVC